MRRGLVAGVARGIGALRRRPRAGLRILMYHGIGHDDRFAVDADRFGRQMAWLREQAALTVTPLADAVRGPLARAATTASITFDDGETSVLTRAVPVLVRHRLPFTVLVIADFLETPPARARYLDAGALRELAAVPGATIGTHGATHRPLTSLTDDALADELRRAAERVGEVIGRRPTVMSYPHGAVDARVARFAGRAGYEAAATSLAGVNRAPMNVLRLRRTEIDALDDDASFAAKMRGDYDWYHLKQRLYWPAPTAAALAGEARG